VALIISWERSATWRRFFCECAVPARGLADDCLELFGEIKDRAVSKAVGNLGNRERGCGQQLSRLIHAHLDDRPCRGFSRRSVKNAGKMPLGISAMAGERKGAARSPCVLGDP